MSGFLKGTQGKPGCGDRYVEPRQDVAMNRLSRISTTDLDSLLMRLDVKFVDLAECHVSPGWSLSFTASKMPGLHYNLDGTGELVVGDNAPIRLSPGSLNQAPPGEPSGPGPGASP